MLNEFYIRKIYKNIPVVTDNPEIHVPSGLTYHDLEIAVLKKLDEGLTQLEAGKAFGASQSTVSKFARARKVSQL